MPIVTKEPSFTIRMTKGDNVIDMTSEKFYSVAIPRNARYPHKLIQAKQDLLDGKTVDGEDINFKSMQFTKVD